MTNPTTPFSWQMPTSSDLVTDLPADFETFGQAVATSMADLLGGTTGQILSKASNTDMDFTWITNDVGDITAVTAGTGISGGGTSGAVTITNDMATTITASGDIVVGTGSGTYDNLPIGTTGQVLTADTTVSPYKVKWATPAGGGSGMTLIRRSSFTNVANTGTTFDTVFSSTYKNYLIVVEAITAATNANKIHVQFRNGSTTLASDYYGAQFGMRYSSTTFFTNNTNNLAHLILTEEGSPGTSLAFYASGVGGTTTTAGIQGTGIDRASPSAITYAGAYYGASVNIDGLIFKSSSTNITGTIAIYGLATS